MDLKLLESVQGCLDDFLEAECLLGDICTRKHTTERNTCKNTKLISVKLVQKISTKT